MAKARIASKAEKQTIAVVRSLITQRAAQRQIPINPSFREVNVLKLRGADYRVNKHEIQIDMTFALTGNPVTMIDKVLDAVQNHDDRLATDRAMSLAKVQSSVMKWAAYLERSMSGAEYRRFIRTLLPNPPGPGPVYAIETLAPDDDDLETEALIFESEQLTQHREIHLRV